MPNRRTRIVLLIVGSAWALVAAVDTVPAATVSLWNPAPTSFDRGGGSQLDVVAPISVTPAEGVTAMDFLFAYDPGVLMPTGVYRTALTNSFSLTEDFATSGLVHVWMNGPTPLTGSGEVAWVVFQVVGAAGSSTDLSWSGATLNSGAIPVMTQNGHVNVISTATIIAMPDDATGAPGAQVDVPISAQTLDQAYGIDLRVVFDSNVLNALSVRKAPLTNSMDLTYNVTKPGEVAIALASADTPVSGSGALVYVTYQVLGSVGDRTPLNLARGQVNEVAMVLDDGLFVACNGIAPPTGRPVLQVAKASGGAQLSWSAVGDATGYDVVRGDLATLRSGGGFSGSTEGCLANDTPSTSLIHQDPQPPGTGSWYLVRAADCGGAGTYDSGAPSQAGGRDAGIAASAFSCP